MLKWVDGRYNTAKLVITKELYLEIEWAKDGYMLHWAGQRFHTNQTSMPEAKKVAVAFLTNRLLAALVKLKEGVEV
jgi:hypothetical protein